MDDATIQALNAINRRFYETVAGEFDASRQRAWAGWEQMLSLVGGNLPTSALINVLDVGCGNGRFGRFLADRLGKDRLRYLGIDSSAALLERAQAALAGIDAQLLARDIVEAPPDAALGTFDLVGLFGVLHHIPGADRRLGLLRALGERVAPGGLLVFTEWRFLEIEALRARIVPWDSRLNVEPGDTLLDWRRGQTALRYCHAVDAPEHERLVAATGLTRLQEFRADAANLYTILRNERLLKQS